MSEVRYSRPTITYKEKLPPPSKRSILDWLVFGHRRLSAPERWDPRCESRNAAGEWVPALSKEAVAWNIEGAMGRDSESRSSEQWDSMGLLIAYAAKKCGYTEQDKFICYFWVSDWEREPTTTFEQVYEVVLEACVIAHTRRYGWVEVVASRIDAEPDAA